jgi:hypothetical protein
MMRRFGERKETENTFKVNFGLTTAKLNYGQYGLSSAENESK